MVDGQTADCLAVGLEGVLQAKLALVLAPPSPRLGATLLLQTEDSVRTGREKERRSITTATCTLILIWELHMYVVYM